MRLLAGASAALVIAAVLIAPVVLLSGGRSRAKPCAQTLIYQGRDYLARPLAQAGVVEAIAIGVGVASGCGTSASHVDIRSLAKVRPSVAVALAGDQSSVYVRRGVCVASSARELMACLRRS